jgi:rhodanese-related sulfurtransferase
MLSWLTGPSVPEVDINEADRQQARGARLVDVREPSEWAEGHIPGSVHIPLGDLGRRVSELDAGQPVVAVCRSGNRSKTAVQVLQRAGFADASSMAGGVVAWAKAGKPLER